MTRAASAMLASRSSRSSKPTSAATSSWSASSSRFGVPPRHHLDRVAHVEQVGVGHVDRAVRPVGEPGRGERAQHDRVADAAARLLELRLDEVGQLTVPVGALPGGGQQLRQPPARGRPPVLQQGGLGAGDDDGVARDRLQVEQPDGRREVLGRHLAALGERPDRVVQVEARVPDGVPELLRERRERLGRVAAALVHEQQVEVADRARVAAPDAADGPERDARDVLTVGRQLPLLPEPTHDELDDRGPPGDAVGAGAGQAGSELEPLRAEVPHPDRGVRDLGRPVRGRAPRGRPFLCHVCLVTVLIRGRRRRAHRCGREPRPRPARPRPCRRRSCRSARRAR